MEHTLSEQLIVVLFMIVGMLITPSVFIALDFWAGIRKSRARGERLRSDKMQRTVRKLSRYYNYILAMLVLDVIQVAGFVFLHIYNGWSLVTFPLFTLISVLFVAAIEIKSILEPADQKESREMKDVSALAKAISESKSDPKVLAEAIASYLRK